MEKTTGSQANPCVTKQFTLVYAEHPSFYLIHYNPVISTDRTAAEDINQYLILYNVKFSEAL